MRFKGNLGAALVAILVVACASPDPTPDPSRVVHVRNNSDRAVIVSVGGALSHEYETAARPCGGELSIAITADRYEDDGRLMVALAIGEDGSFDTTLATWTGDPADMPGDFRVLPIWSNGELAARLPAYLTVAPNLDVTEAATLDVATSVGCTPAY